MFDPPYRTPIAIVGRPISMIPDVEEKYRNFLDCASKWEDLGQMTRKIGLRYRPKVMRRRAEAISAEEWNALTESEQSLIKSWADRLPMGCFYD
jgi:hypothetical protein